MTEKECKIGTPGEDETCVTVNYGKDEEMSFILPSRNMGEIIQFESCDRECQSEEVLDKALAAPHDRPVLSKWLDGAKDILVVVNDATRPTPTSKVMKAITPALNERKEDGAEIVYMVACGSHRAPTEQEYMNIFGADLYPTIKDHVDAHDAKNVPMLVYLGTSSAGTRFLVNKRAVQADRVIIVGSVEPHYFAGFTGGRKSLLPGIAGYETIEANHKHALSPDAKTLALEGNPIHDDMQECAAMFPNDKLFTIQSVVDDEGEVLFASTGDLEKSFKSCVEEARRIFTTPLASRAEIVVTVAPYPMDIDLYQSQKALENSKLAVKDGGAIILVSKCRDGIGLRGFFDLMSSASTPDQVFEVIESGYRLGHQKAAKLAEAVLNCSVFVVSDLSPVDIEKIFMTPYPQLQCAITSALKG